MSEQRRVVVEAAGLDTVETEEPNWEQVAKFLGVGSADAAKNWVVEHGTPWIMDEDDELL